MDGRQKRETDRNIRARDFLNENQTDFAAIPAAVTMIADLTAQAAKVQQEYENQLSGDGEVKQNYSVVKDTYQELLEEMRDISGFARSIGRSITGFADLFHIPAGGSRRKIIAAARVFADNAAPREQEFINYGMDANFINDLRDRADALETALNEAEATTGNRVGATDTLGRDVDAATRTVESIDPIVRRVYRANPTKLAAWTFASHVERHTPVPRVPKPKT